MFKATGAFEFFPRFKIVIEGVELQIENRRRHCKTSLSTTWHKHSFYTQTFLPRFKLPATKKKKKKEKAYCDREIAARLGGLR